MRNLYNELLNDFMSKQASEEDTRDVLEGLSTEELEALAAEIGVYQGNPADVAAMAEVLPVYKTAVAGGASTQADCNDAPASITGGGKTPVSEDQDVQVTASQALYEILKEGAAMEDMIEVRAYEMAQELLKQADVERQMYNANAADNFNDPSQIFGDVVQDEQGNFWQKMKGGMGQFGEGMADAARAGLANTRQFIGKHPYPVAAGAGLAGAAAGYGIVNGMQDREVAAEEMLDMLFKAASPADREELLEEFAAKGYGTKFGNAKNSIKRKATSAYDKVKKGADKAADHVKKHKVPYAVGGAGAAAAAGGAYYASHRDKAASDVLDEVVKEALLEDFCERLAELDGVEFLREAMEQYAEEEKLAGWGLERARDAIHKAITGVPEMIAGGAKVTKEKLKAFNDAWGEFREIAATKGLDAAIAKYPMASGAFATAGGAAIGAGTAGVSGYFSTAPSPNTKGGTSGGVVPNSNVSPNIDFEDQLKGSKIASEYDDLKEFIKAAFLR